MATVAACNATCLASTLCAGSCTCRYNHQIVPPPLPTRRAVSHTPHSYAPGSLAASTFFLTKVLVQINTRACHKLQLTNTTGPPPSLLLNVHQVLIFRGWLEPPTLPRQGHACLSARHGTARESLFSTLTVFSTTAPNPVAFMVSRPARQRLHPREHLRRHQVLARSSRRASTCACTRGTVCKRECASRLPTRLEACIAQFSSESLNKNKQALFNC
jgi:hypothetical protein